MEIKIYQLAVRMLRLLILLSNLILIEVVNCQQEPSISFISKEKIADLGQHVELVCRITNAQNYGTQWIKSIPNSSPIFLANGATTFDSRFYAEMHKDGNYKLIITDVRETDVGKYLCRILMQAQKYIENSVNLFVKIPPVITDDSTRNVITSVNTPLITLICYATGYPNPRIYCRRNRNKLLPNGTAHFVGQQLNIYNVTKDDQGTYYCVADNGVERGARRAISVEVEYPPLIKVIKERIGQAINYNQNLVCYIESFPSANIEWFKEGEQYPIKNSKNYNISIFPTNNEFRFTTVLRVQRIEKRNYGHYLCRASNKLGVTSKKLELFETQNIICPPDCNTQQGYYSTSTLPSISIIVMISFYILTFIF